MMIRTEYNVKLGFLGEITATNNLNDETLINVFKENTPDETISIDMAINHRVIDNQYYLFEENEMIKVFKKLPLVENDNIFEWHNGKYKEGWFLSCGLSMNGMNFCCQYNESTERCIVHVAFVDPVSGYSNHMKTLYVDNATNEKILDAIRIWRNAVIDKFTSSNEIYGRKKYARVKL